MATIYFRTDGNSEIATGHLMRCLAVARACAQKGASVKFIVSDAESLALLQERFDRPQEFAVYCLNRSYKALPQELPALLSCLAPDRLQKPEEADSYMRPWLFIDSYYADSSYFEKLRRHFRTAYLDDLRCFDCAVDLVINYDTDEDCLFYARAARKLLGVQFTPLREQFCRRPYEVRRTARQILLSTGGTDPCRAAETLLRAIFEDHAPLRSMQYHVLTSRANARYEALLALAGIYPAIHIHTNVADVAGLMASCDLAVSAGGTTLCELCAVGVPSVSYLMAENQRLAVETYAKLNLIPYAGDIRPLDSNEDFLKDGSPNYGTLSRILDFLTHMTQDFSARAASSAAMQNFLDGAGAERIADALIR